MLGLSLLMLYCDIVENFQCRGIDISGCKRKKRKKGKCGKLKKEKMSLSTNEGKNKEKIKILHKNVFFLTINCDLCRFQRYRIKLMHLQCWNVVRDFQFYWWEKGELEKNDKMYVESYGFHKKIWKNFLLNNVTIFVKIMKDYK